MDETARPYFCEMLFLSASSLSESEVRHSAVFLYSPAPMALFTSAAADWQASGVVNAASAVKSGRLPAEMT